MSRLFGEPEPQKQRPLFDTETIPKEKKVTKQCPVCGGEFKMPPAVAKVFERCSSCMASGATARRLFEEKEDG